MTVTASGEPIDRLKVVSRHNVRFDKDSPEAYGQVGNGEFAFAFDVTGLQTFSDDPRGRPPLGTMAQWAWHVFPESKQYKYADTLREYDAHGRKVSYATDMRSEIAVAIRSNPHRFNLARISLRLTNDEGETASVDDLTGVSQTLSLWTGEVRSRFEFSGEPVEVRTVAHPVRDAVGFEVRSPLLASGQATIVVSFAYPAGVWGPKIDGDEAPDRHETEFLVGEATTPTRLMRKLDETRYVIDVTSNAELKAGEESHSYELQQPQQDSLKAVFCFERSPASSPNELEFAEVIEASARHWEEFWTSGGAIDLSGSEDPRWRELERRIVLSQYLTAIQCSGSLPPQETGLLCNSWYGKSHLEMHWWHAAHFSLWGRPHLLQRSLDWYRKILPAAKAIAQRQGYAGVRWPKMTGPHGVSSPSEVGELLIWQQPHPIYFAELAYRDRPTPETLRRHQEIIEQTAEFMADYAYFDAETNRYVLGPVLIPAQECYDGRSAPGVMNPTFELAYWRWALRTANEWRRRLELPPNEKWADVAERIARPHHREGVYTAIENAPYTRRHDHPSMLAVFGVLPDTGLINRQIMNRTMLDVDGDWDWAATWGWDYPMMAMTAARLGRGDLAIDYLLRDTPRNRYLKNGHCWQADRLPIYLPANGGLLTAIAMMCAGWDRETSAHASGFPDDGSWNVKHEGLSPMP